MTSCDHEISKSSRKTSNSLKVADSAAMRMSAIVPPRGGRYADLSATGEACVLIGLPDTGKTMLASHLPGTPQSVSNWNVFPGAATRRSHGGTVARSTPPFIQVDSAGEFLRIGIFGC